VNYNIKLKTTATKMKRTMNLEKRPATTSQIQTDGPENISHLLKPCNISEEAPYNSRGITIMELSPKC